AMSVDKSNDRVKNMFAQIAGKYDLMNHLLSLNVDKYWRWKTVKLVPANGSEPILDMCTGTGDLALAYWKETGGEIPIVAADFCPEMLEVGEKKKRKLGINGQVEFVEADAQKLPFDQDHFQLVTVAFGLRNVADTDKGIREMTRVCRPGGKVAVLEFSKPEIQPFKAFYGFYFRNILPLIGRLLAKNDSDAYNYLPESVGTFPSGQELADRMSSCGLTDVWYRPLTLGIASLYVGTKA
ncbi:MAG: bifunctional demethylmenaquinone methyltransferase/2-methoxy-6-polyprenyl-1,4-benzoquinol methylase UbiE, partial [Planctomycetota bacterium]